MKHICKILAMLSKYGGQIGPNFQAKWPWFAGQRGLDFQTWLVCIFRPNRPGFSRPYWPGFPGQIGPDFQAKVALIFRPKRPGFSHMFGLYFHTKLAGTFQAISAQTFQVLMVQIPDQIGKDWPKFLGQIGSDFLAKLAQISRLVGLVFPVRLARYSCHMVLDFQAKSARISRPDWPRFSRPY